MQIKFIRILGVDKKPVGPSYYRGTSLVPHTATSMGRVLFYRIKYYTETEQVSSNFFLTWYGYFYLLSMKLLLDLNNLPSILYRDTKHNKQPKSSKKRNKQNKESLDISSNKCQNHIGRRGVCGTQSISK